MKERVKQQSQLSTIKNQITHLPTVRSRDVTRGGLKLLQAGDDNLLPLTISKIAQGSSTLRSIINSQSDFVSGAEIIVSDKFKKRLDNLNKKYDFKTFLKRVCTDRRTLGYAYIKELRKGKDVVVYHIDASSVRKMKNGNIAISKDWEKIYKTENRPVEYSVYPNYQEEENGWLCRVIPIENYELGNYDYTLPIWSGAFYDAQVESLIGQYNLNTFENGIMLSAILSMDFGDVTSPEELKEKKRKFERDIKGTSNGRGGKTIVHAKSSEVEMPEYVKFPMEKDGSFIKLKQSIENTIVTSMQWFRSLSGLETAGALGNNQQMRNEWEMAEKVISNEQKTIVSSLMKCFEKTEYINEVIEFQNVAPISMLNDVNIVDLVANGVITSDELKTMLKKHLNFDN